MKRLLAVALCVMGLSAPALAEPGGMMPMQPTPTLFLTGDNRDSSPTQVLIGGVFKSNLFPFVTSQASILNVTVNQTTGNDLLLVVYNIPFTAFDPIADAFTFFSLDFLNDGMFTVNVVEGELTLAIIENMGSDPGGTYDLVVENGFLVDPGIVIDGYRIVFPGNPGADAQIQLSELALNAGRFRHSGLNRIIRQAQQARADANSAKWALAGQANTVISTSNGTVAEGFHVWADIGARATNNSAANLTTRTIQTRLGADYEITKEFAAGLGIGYARLQSDTPTTGLQGDSFWAQPYVGFDFGDFYGTLSTAVTYTNYRDFNFGGPGTAESVGYEANLWVGFDHDLGGDATLTPYARGLIGHERLIKVNSTVGLSTTSATYAEGALGTEFRQAFALDQGLLEAYALGELQYTRATGGRNGFAVLNRDPNQIGFGVGAGISLAISDEMSTAIDLKADGLGAQTLGYSGKISIDLAL